jgi:hypothetical protein
VDHLLLQCNLALEFWLLVFSSSGIKWTMSKLVVNMFASWTRQFGRHSSNKTWQAKHSVFEGRARRFEGHEPS